MPQNLDWGGIIPAVNLMLLVFSILYGMATLKAGIKEGLRLIEFIHKTVLQHSDKIGHMESKIEEYAEEIKRVRDRVDKAVDK